MITTVVFDMDGTLIDTIKMTARAFQELAGEYGLDPLNPARIRSCIGLANREFYLELYPDEPEEKREAFSAAIEKRESELGYEMGGEILFPGVRELLARLRAAGKRLLLSSTGTAYHVTSCLEAAGIEEFFEEIGCGVSDKAELTKRLIGDAPLSDCAFVGDSLKDVSAARAVGIEALGALFGYAEEAEEAFDKLFLSPEGLGEYILRETEGK